MTFTGSDDDYRNYQLQKTTVIDYIKCAFTDAVKAAHQGDRQAYDLLARHLRPQLQKWQTMADGPGRRAMLGDLVKIIRNTMGNDYRPHELWSTLASRGCDADRVLNLLDQ